MDDKDGDTKAVDDEDRDYEDVDGEFRLMNQMDLNRSTDPFPTDSRNGEVLPYGFISTDNPLDIT